MSQSGNPAPICAGREFSDGGPRSGDTLTFGQMAGTMMACAQGMDSEKAFLEALGQVNKWKTGQHLELFDARGKLVARFEARHLK